MCRAYLSDHRPTLAAFAKSEGWSDNFDEDPPREKPHIYLLAPPQPGWRWNESLTSCCGTAPKVLQTVMETAMVKAVEGTGYPGVSRDMIAHQYDHAVPIQDQHYMYVGRDWLNPLQAHLLGWSQSN